MCREGRRIHRRVSTRLTAAPMARAVRDHDVSKTGHDRISWVAVRKRPIVMSRAALRAGPRRRRGRCLADRRWRRWVGEEPTREGEARGPTRVGEIAELTNADEAARQDVLHESPEKFDGRERHRAPLPVVGVVLPAKRDALAVEGEQAMIADRHAMGVATEVAQHGGGAAEGGFRIDDPVGLKQRVDQRVPAGRVTEHGGGAAEIKRALGVGAPQPFDKLATKHPTQDLHGEKEAARIWDVPSVGDLARSLRPARRSARADASRGFGPRCGGCSRKPISAPRWRGSAATSRRVAALARNNRSYRRAALRRHSGLSVCGSVKTTWTYDTSSSSRSRAANQRARACAWHFGQCRLRHELYEMARCPQVPH